MQAKQKKTRITKREKLAREYEVAMVALRTDKSNKELRDNCRRISQEIDDIDYKTNLKNLFF
jgi:hypothetical protein